MVRSAYRSPHQRDSWSYADSGMMCRPCVYPPPLAWFAWKCDNTHVSAKAHLSPVCGGEAGTKTFEVVSGNGLLVKGDG